MFVCKVCMRNCAHICGWSNVGMLTLAFTADSRQTEAGRLYNRSEEDETRTPLQKAIDDADYEHGHRVNELDFLTAFRSPVMVARKSNCAFNTVRISSTGRPWIVDNDSRGGDDEHAQPNAELAIELTAPPTPPFDADATRRCRRRCRPPHSRCCRRPPRTAPPVAAPGRGSPPRPTLRLRNAATQSTPHRPVATDPSCAPLSVVV